MVVASTSKPSTPAIAAMSCAIHEGIVALRVEKLTAIEVDGNVRDIMPLSGSRVVRAARRCTGALTVSLTPALPPLNRACLFRRRKPEKFLTITEVDAYTAADA